MGKIMKEIREYLEEGRVLSYGTVRTIGWPNETLLLSLTAIILTEFWVLDWVVQRIDVWCVSSPPLSGGDRSKSSFLFRAAPVAADSCDFHVEFHRMSSWAANVSDLVLKRRRITKSIKLNQRTSSFQISHPPSLCYFMKLAMVMQCSTNQNVREIYVILSYS